MLILRKCIAIVPVALLPSIAAGQLYSLVDIGDLPGGINESAARDINNRGMVVGGANSIAGPVGFVWHPREGLRELSDLSGGASDSIALGVNNSGVICGVGRSAAGQRAVMWGPDRQPIDLGVLTNGTSSEANAISDDGTIVGWSYVFDTNAFRWSLSDGMQYIGDLPDGGTQSEATGVNSLGTIVGASGAVTGPRAFVWEPATGMRDLGDLVGGADGSKAEDINDRNEIVGRGSNVDGEWAVLWRGDSLINLGSLGNSSEAFGVNNRSQVVGVSNQRAFIWDDVNGMRDLNSLVNSTGTGWTVTDAYAINDLSWIACRAINSSGIRHAVVLRPTPCAGDLDDDGDNDLGDLAILLAAYGGSARGDLNGDGKTDIGDLARLLRNFGCVPVIP